MPTDNCTEYGKEPTIIYGYAARKIKNDLDVTLCLPAITNHIEFDIQGKHSEENSQTQLGYQLKQATDPVVIYTDTSQMPPYLRDELGNICNLVDCKSVEFEMCVGSYDVMLPNAEYDGETIERTDVTRINRCSHDYDDSLDFVQSALDYPAPE